MWSWGLEMNDTDLSSSALHICRMPMASHNQYETVAPRAMKIRYSGTKRAVAPVWTALIMGVLFVTDR